MWLPVQQTPTFRASALCHYPTERFVMRNIVWIVGAVVIVLAVLSFVGLR